MRSNKKPPKLTCQLLSPHGQVFSSPIYFPPVVPFPDTNSLMANESLNKAVSKSQNAVVTDLAPKVIKDLVKGYEGYEGSGEIHMTSLSGEEVIRNIGHIRAFLGVAMISDSSFLIALIEEAIREAPASNENALDDLDNPDNIELKNYLSGFWLNFTITS